MQRSTLNSPDPWVLLVLCKRCWLLQCSLSCKSSARNGNWFGEYSVQENTFNKQSFIGTLLCLVPELSECLTTGEALHRRLGKGHRQDWVSPFPEHQELIPGRHENMNTTFISYNCSTFAWGGTGPQRCSLKSTCVILVFAHFCHLTAFHTTQGPVNRAGKGLVVHWPLLHLLSSAQTVQKQPFMTHRQTTGPHSSKTLLRQHCACSLIVVYQLRYSSQRVFDKYWTHNSQIEGSNNWSLR